MSTSLHDMVLAAYANQDTLNKKLREDWVTQGWPYYRAIWTEAGEAVQHIKSWFWWKEGEFGRPPTEEVLNHVRMELIDILHFGLSVHLIDVNYGRLRGGATSDSFDRQAKLAVDCFQKPLTSYSPGQPDYMIQTLEVLVEYAIGTRCFDWRPFSRACLAAKMDLEMTLALYFAKTTLNKFRYDNGYNLPKDHPKKYIKMWGRTDWDFRNGPIPVHEDNVVLQDIVTALLADGFSLLESDLETFSRKIYVRLHALYPGEAAKEPLYQLSDATKVS